jgi:rhodanese-related sulfurtransferase
MLKKLAVVLLLSTAAYAQEAPKSAPAANARPATKAKKLTNAEFDAYLAHPEKVLLIDVRRPDEISTIGGFPVYLSIQIKDLKDHLNEIPRDREIITVSNHAARAAVAADLLDSAGFKVLGAVGADTYQQDGGKLAVKIPVPPARNPGDAAHSAAGGETGKP